MWDTMWTMPEALQTIRRVETALCSVGWHTALGGGVLLNGESPHDLDIVVYPHVAGTPYWPVPEALINIGWRRTHTAAQMRAHWRTKGSTDTKHVECWRTSEDKRVDIIAPTVCAAIDNPTCPDCGGDLGGTRMGRLERHTPGCPRFPL